MTLESIAGKNPITHVGKLYNLVAGLIANDVLTEIDDIITAYCVLVSRIGEPIREPQIMDIRLLPRDSVTVDAFASRVEDIARAHLDRIDQFADDLIDGRLAVDRWPLRIPARRSGRGRSPAVS